MTSMNMNFKFKVLRIRCYLLHQSKPALAHSQVRVTRLFLMTLEFLNFFWFVSVIAVLSHRSFSGKLRYSDLRAGLSVCLCLNEQERIEIAESFHLSIIKNVSKSSRSVRFRRTLRISGTRALTVLDVCRVCRGCGWVILTACGTRVSLTNASLVPTYSYCFTFVDTQWLNTIDHLGIVSTSCRNKYKYVWL